MNKYDPPAARNKSGRASGGTRYYSGKKSAEDKMVELMDRALKKRKDKNNDAN